MLKTGQCLFRVIHFFGVCADNVKKNIHPQLSKGAFTSVLAKNSFRFFFV